VGGRRGIEFCRRSDRIDISKVAEPYEYNKPIGHYGVPQFPACQLRTNIVDLTKFLVFFTGIIPFPPCLFLF
jgi:hypothetical protein